VVAGAGPAGEPVVDVVLGARGEGGAAVPQPADQGDRCPDLVVHVVGLLGGDVVPGGLAAQAPQVMPGGEAARGPALGGIGDLAGLGGDPLLELGEPLVAGGKDAAGHEDLAQVTDRLILREPVEVGVGGGTGCLADRGEYRGGGAPGQPLHQRVRVAGGQDVVDRLGVRVQAALVVGEQAEQVLAGGAAGAQPVVVEAFGGPAARAGPERCRVLAVARAAQGTPGKPGRDGADFAAGAARHSELPRVFRTGNLRLNHAASCPFRYSSMTSCGVL
jgi:hypothetical protein